MNIPAFTVIIALVSAQPVVTDLDDIQNTVQALAKNNAAAATASTEQLAQLKPEHDRLVGRMRDIADTKPQDLPTQISVARGFLTADEPNEATEFADRAAGIAEQKGDSKSLGDALTLAAFAYQKTGDYERALARSKRALEVDPTNKAAMSVYQMSKGRVSVRPGASPASSGPGTRRDEPAAPAGGAASGTGRSSFPPAVLAPASAAPSSFVGAGAEKALKLTAEAGRRWPLDKAAALRLLEEAVASDARNAAARAARARARLELGDAAGALEDADAALAAGPSAAMRALKGEALLALGRKGEDVLAEFEAAAALDGEYSTRYQELIARGGKAAPGASAPDPARRMGEKEGARPSWLLSAAGAALIAMTLVWLLLSRRRDE